MTRWQPGPEGFYDDYGLGLGRYRFPAAQVIGHHGVWGAFAFWSPELDAVITGTINTGRVDRRPLLEAVVRALLPPAAAPQPTMTPARTPSPLTGRSLRAPVLWGIVWGGIQAASPLGFWWLDPATVYALSLTLIAAVYIGFAVADGRPTVIAVEAAIAAVFVVVAAAGVTGPAWLLAFGLAGHGCKDLWQHRSHYVANTRWWPPFCLVVDWVAAAILVVLLTVGVDFHS
jgi:hypothetical protein